MKIVEIKNITKRYDDKLAVDNVSLNVEKGDIFGLLGPNGAGKSTLISMICGLVKQDKGVIRIANHSIKKEAEEAKKYIGLVPQEIALYENLSGIDNLVFWGSMYGLKGKELKSRIKEVLKVAGLEERAKDKVGKYSGGMKRRLNIVAAIMHHPEIIIMDEPTVGIDPQSRNYILEVTKNFNKKYGTTIIYTSHYMEEVEALCNKVAILDEGKLITCGTKEKIKRMSTEEEKIELLVENFNEEIILKLKRLEGVTAVDYLYPKLELVVVNSQKNLESIIEILISASIVIKDISIKVPNLETVFLSLTGKKLRD